MPDPVSEWVAVSLAEWAATSGVYAAGTYTVAFSAATYSAVYAAAYAATTAAVVYGSSTIAKSMAGNRSAFADQGRNVMVRDPISPRRKIYGQILTTGPMYPVGVSGTKNEFFHFAILLAGHECQELGDIYFTDEVVPLDGSGDATGKYAGYVHIGKQVGSDTQTAEATFTIAFPGTWTAAHKGLGVAYLGVRLKYSTDLFSGVPMVKCMTKGAKVYDPRDGTQDPNTPSTWKWSSNAALCVADFLHDSVYGRGIPWSRIDMTALIEAANVCDEDVVLADTTTEKRYTINGTVTADQNKDAVLEDMVNAMAGIVVDVGGIWTIRAGAWRAPTLTLGDGDLAGPVTVQPRQSMQDTYNGVKGVFISPLNAWQPGDFPGQKNDTYKAKDGGIRRWKDIALNYTISSPTAQRIAKIDLERGRQQITFSALYKLKALSVIPGDVVYHNRDKLGWVNKPFEATEWALQLYDGPDGGKCLGVRITWRETASGVWDWSNGEETTDDLSPNTNLPDPSQVPTPTGLTASNVGFLQPDGTVQPRVQLVWDSPNNVYVENGHTVIEWKKSTDTSWAVWNRVRGDVLLDFVTDVKYGINYDFRIVHENEVGARSNNNGASTAPDYQTVSNFAVTGDSSAPATPGGLSFVTGTGKSVSLAWTRNTESDLDEYIVYRSTDNITFSEIARVTANRFVDVNVSLGTSYYYKIAARDYSANTSPSTASVGPATPGLIGAGSIDTTPPSNPAALSFSSSGTRIAGDGTISSYIVATAPTMPTGAVGLNIYCRINGASDWVLMDQVSAGGGTVTMDGLQPGGVYQLGVQAYSIYGYTSSLVITAGTTTAPNTTASPSTPSGGSLSSSGVIPKQNPSRGSYPFFYFGTLVAWNANTEADLDHYEIKATLTDSDSAVDYSWASYDQTGVIITKQPNLCLYNGSLQAGYVRVRAVNRSGLQSPWLRIGNANASATIPVGQAASMDQGTSSTTVAAGNDSRITGAAQKSSNLSDLSSPSTALQNLSVRSVNTVQNLSGGGTTENFTYNHNFGVTYTKVVCECIDPPGNVKAVHNYSDAGNNSNNTVIQCSNFDGSALSGGLRRFVIYFLP